MANTESRIKEAEEALDFCRSAVEDAIYLEDGLDGSTGEAVVKMIMNYFKSYRPDLYRDYQEDIERRSKQPQI